MTTMLKFTAGSLAAGWALLVLIGISGHLVWDNRLLYLPPALFGLATYLGLTGCLDQEHRVALLLLAALGLCSFLAFGVFYVFLFGLVGR